MKATETKAIDGIVEQSDISREDFLYGGDELSNMMSRAGMMKRTKDVDKEETIAIVKAAQGERSMRQFAEEMGVNVSSISRILNGSVTEIRPPLLASIVYHAAPGSGVTLEKLLNAQGLTMPEERRPVGKREKWESKNLIADELLLRGYSVRYVIPKTPLIDMSFFPTYVLRTDAFPGEDGNWYFIDKLCKQVKRVSIAMVDSWFNSIMALYYRGLKAKRVSLVVDSDDLFRAMKKLMERYEIKDEMSVILVSMETGKVLEEYVAPLTDGRTAELVLTGEIKEEQHDE